MSTLDFDILSGSADTVGVQVEVDHREATDALVSKVITVTGADADEVNVGLEELGALVEDMRLVAIKGDAAAAEFGFDGPLPAYAEPCFCSADEWCSHNLPEEPEAS